MAETTYFHRSPDAQYTVFYVVSHDGGILSTLEDPSILRKTFQTVDYQALNNIISILETKIRGSLDKIQSAVNL